MCHYIYTWFQPQLGSSISLMAKYLPELFGTLLHGKFVFSPFIYLFIIYLIIYFYQCGHMGFYFVLQVIMQYDYFFFF